MMAGALKSSPKKNVLLVAFLAVYVCFCLLSTVGAASAHIPNKREMASPDETDVVPTICSRTTPCGWAVYITGTRQIDYFMRNTCHCHHTMTCTKSGDDLNIHAYVYRCKLNSATANE